ncbi:hypothetical protein G6F31_015327 [Rhizopus arrhizus]|nr:hypothetical protein G6F31_015327 [Rhizopus arrhizus]
MSGSLRVLPGDTPLRAHDHVDISLDNGRLLRFNDPRRFGSLLWQPAGEIHPLLQGLGPEPLDDAFDGDYLFARSRGRSAPVKTFLMDQAVVVGVGNIYAAESLFKAGISPLREAGKISRERYQRLADAVKEILGYAITRGGTTLRDFISPDGAPGYFEQELLVTPPSASVPASGAATASAEPGGQRQLNGQGPSPLPVNVCLPMMADLPSVPDAPACNDATSSAMPPSPWLHSACRPCPHARPARAARWACAASASRSRSTLPP